MWAWCRRTRLALAKSTRAYNVFVLALAAGGILLMTLPAELLNWKPEEKPELDLQITFSTLTTQGWLSLALTAIGFGLMVTDSVGADFTMNLVLVLMVVFKLITVKNAIAGFAAQGLLTVVTLFMVAQGITSTGGADWIITKLLGTPSDTSLAQVRMCLVTTLFSSFVNNTPVFCIMLPIVLTWAAKSKIPVRQLLIPLSFCALLGGTNTIIGTSTNLVVTQQFDAKVLDPKGAYYQPGATPITLFDLTPYGLPNAMWGIITIVLLSPFLLTEGAGKRAFAKVTHSLKRKGGADAPLEMGGEFFMGLLVTEGSPVVGRSIDGAGLRSLAGQFVVAVRHHSRVSHAVDPDFVLSAGDVLYLSGIPDGVQELADKFGLIPYSDALEEIDASELPGVETAFGITHATVPRCDDISTGSADSDKSSSGSSSSSTGGSDSKGTGRASFRQAGESPPELIEATIKKGASIVGQTIRGAAFRSRFHAAVVSIKRNNVAIDWSGKRIGEEVLQAEDRLLLDVSPQFWTTPEVGSTFVNICKSGQVHTHNEFMLPMRVTRFMAGKSIQGAGLRSLPNAFLASLTRGATTLHAVSPDEVLEVDDVLWFAVDASSVRFIRNTPGLVPQVDRHARKLVNTPVIDRRLVQAIVAQGSPLAGKTVRELHFRDQFNAVVVAVARNGERVQAKPGDILLRAGDILLLDTGHAFARQQRQGKYFSIVIEMDNSNPPRFLHTGIAIASIATAFILYALEILDILPGAAIVVAVMLLTGCMSPEQARRAIKWEIYLMIAGSFGVSLCLEQTGAAAAIANLFITVGRKLGGATFIIGAVYLSTAVISQIIANNAAAAIVWPVAATIAKVDSMDVYILSYAVMLGASSVFMSSFGYQTNLMALAAGGHSSLDFVKIGAPMQLVVAAVCITNLATGAWQMVWIVTGIAGAIVMGAPQVVEWVTVWQAKKAHAAALWDRKPSQAVAVAAEVPSAAP